MFETAELDHRISKAEFLEREPALRKELLEAQVRLRELHLRALVLFAGVDGAGKGETANLLNAWMDPHLILTHAYGPSSDDERERPYLWRFWRDMPARGQLGIFLSAWYSRPLLDHVYGRSSEQEFEDQLHDIASFERTLRQDGVLILKFWMHLGKGVQRRRLETLEADPLRKWRVSKQDWKHWKLYDRFIDTAERIISFTSRGGTPWKIVDGSDPRYRSLTVGTFLLAGLKRQIRDAERPSLAPEETRAVPGTDGEPPPEAQPEHATATTTVLDGLDLTLSIPKLDYDHEKVKYQSRLNLLQRTARERGISTMVVFEGWDAAGKGGAIRRLVAPLDARDVQVISTGAPTDEELGHHHLWRFWRHVPRAGRFVIFDRSWYGRVLVERVERLATEREWRRAYGEINDFERQLVRHGIVLVKFWIHISPEEQERRFETRRSISYKRWKLTQEDWRNRDRWRDYEIAVHEMVERTGTRTAPWTLVEGNDKFFARTKVLKATCESLEANLERWKDDDQD